MSHANSLKARGARLFFVAVALLCLLLGMSSAVRAAGDPAQGPGGPILVLTSGSSTFGNYYAEILRTEGLNSFAVADISTLTPAALAPYDVVILAKTPLASAQVTILTNWVNAGGNLIAMAPDAALAGLLGIAPVGTSLSNGYLLVDTSTRPGNGIVNQTIQFHGAADLYNLNGATRLATLYSTATVATNNPAVTLFSAGSGKAAAFTYDLATSVVYTRQGNPAWAAQERDGFTPIRSDDKFYGNAAGDVKPDWIDLNKVAIPQADEQQRLLANLILDMNASRKPLPRFWYFPNGKKAVVIMSGDDHGNGGTGPRFDQFKAASPAGCSVANWECIRGTSYIYTPTPLSNAQAAQYDAEGFEIGLHINTGCADFDRVSLESIYVQQLADWQAKYSSIPAPITQRHHCIVWSDWSTGAEVQLNHGMRLDTSYYFWPPSWVSNVPGLFTGSAMPMRFTRLDGTFVDVFMAASQMTDESGQTYPFTVNTLLDRAIGAEGYFGVYTINAHTDAASSAAADAVVSSAVARGVPIVTSRQMLTWLDGRNSSSFGSISGNLNTLSFTVNASPAATGLQAMLPTRSGNGVLGTITLGASPVAFTVSTVKGVEYAFFAANSGSYTATYAADSIAPQVTSITPAASATGISVSVRPTATFSEAIDPVTVNASTFDLRDSANVLVSATVTYDASSRTATLTPSGPLIASSTYTATLHGGATDPRIKDAAGNALSSNTVWSFTTAAPVPPPTCPCGGFSSSATPANASVADPSAVELGVRFTADVNGFITGIRFYKGAGNTGTHIGNLWSAAGVQLATATFTAETASGWQQVNFASPVAINANTVYVASYFAPNGNYAADSNYFATNGVDNPPVHLLKDGVGGSNGLYTYGSASSFPISSFQSTNYWVDIAFTTVAPIDTTPPTVTTSSPANGTTGVAVGASVSATFSEAVDPASLTSSTFELRGPANVSVTGSVSYNASTRTATLTPNSPLLASTTYTATLRGGTIDPRVKDLAGNALAANVSWIFTTGAVGGSCAAPANAIVAENCLVGNPASEWDISGAGDPSIQGFATQISVNRGSTVSFKVNTSATGYRFDIYRMGYYGGNGARKVASSVVPTATLPQTQGSCLNDTTTGLIDCGNWAVSGSWAVPANAASGIYFAKLIRTDTGGASHIVFVVRDDAGTSNLVFQTSDTTWQAYNNYGGNSLYTGLPVGRAYKVSYNRPFNTRAVDGGQDWVFNAEYPMVRWLEANGYDVSYASGVDTDRSGSLLLNHKTFLSVGHDEYWSGGQRASVEAARNAGVNLAFFSGNEIFWKTRWENSIDGSATPYRTLVTYKETSANAKIDPTATWTGTWRDPRFSPPADGGRPENALSGTIFMNNDTGTPYAITVPETDGKMRLWRNTSIAALAAGQTATLPIGTLGYEWDTDLDNGARPAGLFRMSSTTITSSGVLQDFGSTYAAGTLTHYLTLYRHSSGAKVFGAGTIQWPWGLDSNHDRGSTPVDVRMQQATVNLFADMGAQPGTLQAGLVAAAASIDATPPTSTIASPAVGANIPAGNAVTISGTASDAGGGVVGGVEVSVDGGTTWHPANGRGTWTYNWTPSATGAVTLKSRAVDDTGNLEVPGAGVAVTVAAQTCPCTIWSALAVPTNASDADTGAVNLGVKFKSDMNGFITGIRFYKGTANTGTHIGTLWSSAGAQLATATFTAESASGWQQVNFASPVAVTANTVYVASYFAPNGRYAGDNAYFTTKGVDNPPLHALQDGASGGNGVYRYGSGTVFPDSTFQSSNYWVDVVFSTAVVADTTPPTVTTVAPASAATGVSRTTAVTATFSEAMDATTISAANFELRDPSSALVAATVAYNTATNVATLTPSAALAASTTFTATVKVGVKDLAGNALASSQVWSFTTIATDTTPPTVSAISPASGATGVRSTANVTATFSEAMDATSITASAFELRTSANAVVPAVVSYNATTRVATLNPTPSLSAGPAYTAIVRGGSTDPRVKDAAGNALAADRSWSFSIETVPPKVTAISPASGAVSVSRTANVTATFSEAMDATTISAANFELRDPSSALVAATVAYNTATNVATLTPSAALAASTTFTATVKVGVKDLAGNALASSQVWSFTTIATDTTPPTVSAISPASGATGVRSTANVTATFSEAMDATSITASAFELRTSANAVVPAVVSYNATTRVATLNPTPSLSAGPAYTAIVRGGSTDPRVKDAAGNALAADRSWSFSIETVPPKVTAISPASGAVSVSRTANVTVTFSEAMDPATINTNSIELRDSGNALVAAAVTYSAATRVVTLSPTPTLGSVTTYTVNVKGGATDPRVKDLAGNALASTRSWSFTTAP